MWSGRVTSQKRKYDQFEHLAEAEEQACTEMGKQLTAMTNSLSEIGTRLPSAHAIHRCVQDLNAACADPLRTYARLSMASPLSWRGCTKRVSRLRWMFEAHTPCGAGAGSALVGSRRVG